VRHEAWGERRRDRDSRRISSVARIPMYHFRMPHIDQVNALVDSLERRIIKDKLRFAVVKPDGPASGMWGAWNSGNEFYVAAMNAIGNTKISLHSTGRCRLAIIKEALPETDPEALPPGGDRAFVKWFRPAAPEEGAHLALTLTFPAEYLHALRPEGSAKKPVLLFETSDPTKAVQFGFFFSREDPGSLEAKFLKIGKPIFRWGLRNGEAVWLVKRDTEFDKSVIPPPERWERSLRVVDLDRSAFEQSLGLDKKLNAILWNHPSLGDPLQLIEIGGLSIIRTLGRAMPDSASIICC
jgi:hypothetical protein